MTILELTPEGILSDQYLSYCSYYGLEPWTFVSCFSTQDKPHFFNLTLGITPVGEGIYWSEEGRIRIRPYSVECTRSLSISELNNRRPG